MKTTAINPRTGRPNSRFVNDLRISFTSNGMREERSFYVLDPITEKLVWEEIYHESIEWDEIVGDANHFAENYSQD